ncbi:MAG TPA: phosphate ABC transporter ATP-binding protein [Streptosporangiaceae bacterium]|nr:phosphate ABC transporter ATP-binding protein [Streptosporangiaceae bacterium]
MGEIRDVSFEAGSVEPFQPGVASIGRETATTGKTSPAPTVRTNRLTLGFGPKTVLEDISLDFTPGAVTALLGPTGSGKTTFLRSLNRMNDKVRGYRRSGDVLVGDRSIWASGTDPMALRRQVGMLFQRPNPFPMSIGDNVVAGPRAHRMVPRAQLKAIAERMLKEVGLWDAVSTRLRDSPFRLSGGQQQLLCLARALAVDPEVLLLDEPTSSLDPQATEAIEALIRSLTPRLTIIIVTHNLAQARRVSDDTVFFYQGRLIEYAPTAKLFEAPEKEETKNYISGGFG